MISLQSASQVNQISRFPYLQRIPYENCDNLADYLSLQRAAQAQHHIQSQSQMSLLKFLAIVSTRCLQPCHLGKKTFRSKKNKGLPAWSLGQCANAWPGGLPA